MSKTHISADDRQHPGEAGSEWNGRRMMTCEYNIFVGSDDKSSLKRYTEGQLPKQHHDLQRQMHRQIDENIPYSAYKSVVEGYNEPTIVEACEGEGVLKFQSRDPMDSDNRLKTINTEGNLPNIHPNRTRAPPPPDHLD